MSAVWNTRRPYEVTYYDLNGVKQTLRRRPPPKQHDILPQDEVELIRGKNADWQADSYSVKHINPRHPNVLQITDGDGNHTFVDAHDVELDEMIAPRPGADPRDTERNASYLVFP